MKTEKAGAGFRLGPGMASLLLILVTLLMAALAILAMAGAQTDATLSARNLEMTQSYYEAAAQIQQKLADVDRRLYDARMLSMGDLDAYVQRVHGIQAGYPTGEDNAESGARILCVAVPMANECYLEALLRVPLTLTGPRYVLLSHKLADEAPWEAEQGLRLFVDIDDMELIEPFDMDDFEP